MMDGYYGTDQIYPDMEYTYELSDTIDNELSETKSKKDDDKYMIDEDKKEKFIEIQQPPRYYNPNNDTKELIKNIYSKITTNIFYLFIIFILVVICINQKQNMDQIKLLLMIALNDKNSNIIKAPIT